MHPHTNLNVDIDRSQREVTVAGEVDFETRSQVTDAAAELRQAGRGDISLDLDDVTFIDASGVGAVLEVDAAQVEQGAALHAWSGNSFVRRVFTLCGLTSLLGQPRKRRSRPQEP